MIVEVPADTALTAPELAFIVAIPVLLLLQVPPDVEFVRVLVPFRQADRVPPMAARTGSGFTVTVISLLRSTTDPAVALRRKSVVTLSPPDV